MYLEYHIRHFLHESVAEIIFSGTKNGVRGAKQRFHVIAGVGLETGQRHRPVWIRHINCQHALVAQGDIQHVALQGNIVHVTQSGDTTNDPGRFGIRNVHDHHAGRTGGQVGIMAGDTNPTGGNIQAGDNLQS